MNNWSSTYTIIKHAKVNDTNKTNKEVRWCRSDVGDLVIYSCSKTRKFFVIFYVLVTVYKHFFFLSTQTFEWRKFCNVREIFIYAVISSVKPTERISQNKGQKHHQLNNVRSQKIYSILSPIDLEIMKNLSSWSKFNITPTDYIAKSTLCKWLLDSVHISLTC